MSKVIHIICLDAPSPPDYGGVFDLYYKIPALAALGNKIILHYFDYKENRSANGLEPYCLEIYKYPRAALVGSLLSHQPYIVSSRINQQLIERLNSDDHPVFMEGIHCTGILPYLNKNKKAMLRLHNNEAAYYEHLSKTEKHLLKRQYLKREYKLLERYQGQLNKNLPLLTVSTTDLEAFKTRYGFNHLHFLPCFIPWQNINGKTGKGSYCLYHGNMEVSENREAALWLANEVFAGSGHKLIIAGKNAAYLDQFIKGPEISIENNPSDEGLTSLIRDAQVNVLPSFNVTGVKIKILHALFEGRFCLTNEAGINGSGLHGAEMIANDARSMINAIDHLMEAAFTEADIMKRKEMMALYDNGKNAVQLNELLKHYL